MIKYNKDIDDPLIHVYAKGAIVTYCGVDLSKAEEEESPLTEDNITCIDCLEKLIDKY